jgi:hypothetical protein
MSRALGALGLGLLAVLCSCGEDELVTGARAGFARFQDATLAGDRTAMMRSVTQDSRAAIHHVDIASAQQRERLEVLSAEARNAGRVELRVADPNAGGAQSVFVVLRERGEWRVDILATAAANYTLIEGGPSFVPNDERAERIDGIDATEASAIR